MRTNYDRGRALEYQVKRFAEKQGWACFRTAGSHSVADLIFMRAGEICLVQVKTDGYIPPVERLGLIIIARELQVIPMLAYKEKGKIVLKELKEE